MINRVDILFTMGFVIVGIYGLLNIHEQYKHGTGSLGEAIFVSLALLALVGFGIRTVVSTSRRQLIKHNIY